MTTQELFNEFLERVVNLNPDRIKRIKEAQRVLTDFISNHPDFKDLFIETIQQGSARQKTIIKPIGDHGSFDVDLMIRLKKHASWTPKQYLTKLADAFRMLSLAQAEEYRSLIATFLAFFHEEEKAGRHFNFTDCALGNILFAGCFLQNGRDFNRTIRAFSRFYEVPEDTLLNITQGESLFLVAEKEDGSMLLAEGDIVAAQSAATPIVPAPMNRTSLRNVVLTR